MDKLAVLYFLSILTEMDIFSDPKQQNNLEGESKYEFVVGHSDSFTAGGETYNVSK